MYLLEEKLNIRKILEELVQAEQSSNKMLQKQEDFESIGNEHTHRRIINFELNDKNMRTFKCNEDNIFMERVKRIPPIKTFDWSFTKVVRSNYHGNLQKRTKLYVSDTFKRKILMHLKYLQQNELQKSSLGKRNFQVRNFEKIRLKRVKTQKIRSPVPNLQIQKLHSGTYSNFGKSSDKNQTTNNSETLAISELSLADRFTFQSEDTKSGKRLFFGSELDKGFAQILTEINNQK